MQVLKLEAEYHDLLINLLFLALGLAFTYTLGYIDAKHELGYTDASALSGHEQCYGRFGRIPDYMKLK